ncbi:MAG: class I SAM-dependent methyltransferase [Butyrivibrio sp.]|jgi:2-polyprenyl-3-methyl-5-hydroxy-6-metoxy-1,4-benzoquinol methylase|nr:class I SAM-dependent methyltransferase [Butyrivibrio sp.]
MAEIKYIGGVKIINLSDENEEIYNEGDDVEQKVLATVMGSTSYDVHVNELNKDSRWPVLYELSKRRQMIVEPMNITSEEYVLEVGAGMGAITGALAKRAKHVDCIELSERRSMANAYRNREYENITITVANFENVEIEKEYDVIILNGVLEYATLYIHSKRPYEDFLNKLFLMLKKSGRIYIAIENKLGIKYLAGCVEDHLGSFYSGVENYQGSVPARTFTKSQLTKLLFDAGYKDIFFYYPFPDYKLPTEIYSDEYMPNEDSNLRAFENYDSDRVVIFDEEKAYEGMIGTDEMKVLFNSFLVEAVKK